MKWIIAIIILFLIICAVSCSTAEPLTVKEVITLAQAEVGYYGSPIKTECISCDCWISSNPSTWLVSLHGEGQWRVCARALVLCTDNSNYKQSTHVYNICWLYYEKLDKFIQLPE